MYESFFGLTGPPFRLIPDPSCLFVGKAHREAFAALREGLAAGARVMVLTGDVGAGKTTLLQALLASVDSAATVTVHVSAAHLDAEALSGRLSEALGLPSQPDALARRDRLLTALASCARTTLLVIDEAQHLAPSALDLIETLANATAPAAVPIQICLVGQPELRILLNAARRGAFRELIGVDRHLRPLEQEEIRLYVEHRLHRAGWTGRPEFEDEAFSEIFIFTAGNPRCVNLLCNSLMLAACGKRQQRIDASAVTWAAAAMREDALHGEPDVLDLGSHFEHRPTLMEAFASNGPGPETAIHREDASLGAAAESSGEATRAPEGPATAAHDTVQDDAATSVSAADVPASPTMGNGTSPDVTVPRSDLLTGPMQQQPGVSRRRRQAFLVSAAIVAVALALLAYVIDQQGAGTNLSPNELRNIAADRQTSPAASRTAPDRLRRGAGSVAPASSAQETSPVPSSDVASRARGLDAAPVRAPADGDNLRGKVADEVPEAARAAPEHAVPADPAAAQTPTPSCSGPAFALGLCDADSSSTRRQ